MLNKIKNLLKKENKNETFINTNLSKEDWKFINNPLEETNQELPIEMKIASQKIGLDLTQVKPSNLESMTSGYIDFKPEEIVYNEIPEGLKSSNPDLYYKLLYENAEKTVFEMKKVKRASEKVVEKIIEIEKYNKTLESNENKREHSKFNR